MRKLVFMLGSTALLLAQVVAAAAPAAESGPAAAARYGRSIPDQPYYPPGYRDLRIAAAAQVATFPRAMEHMVMADEGGRNATYDLIDCNAEYFDSATIGAEAAVQSDLAMDVARIGGELRRLGYRPAVFEEPLLAYERDALADLPRAVAERGEGDAANAALAEAERTAETQPETAPTEAEMAAAEAAADAAEAAADAAVAMAGAVTDEEVAAGYGAVGKLVLEMEKRRARLQPDKPKIVTEGGCGAGEAAFLIRTAPANGKVWVINAFAFHVCMTKVRDPWNLQACRWTEVDPDNATMASGRYMYQARWPDGKIARGARIFEGDFDSDAPTAITIRRN